MGVVIKFNRKLPPEQVRGHFSLPKLTLDMLKDVFAIKRNPNIPANVVAIDPPGKLDADIVQMFDDLGMSPPSKKD